MLKKRLIVLVLILVVFSSFASSSHLGENEGCGFWCQYFGNREPLVGQATYAEQLRIFYSGREPVDFAIYNRNRGISNPNLARSQWEDYRRNFPQEKLKYEAKKTLTTNGPYTNVRVVWQASTAGGSTSDVTYTITADGTSFTVSEQELQQAYTEGTMARLFAARIVAPPGTAPPPPPGAASPLASSTAGPTDGSTTVTYTYTGKINPNTANSYVLGSDNVLYEFDERAGIVTRIEGTNPIDTVNAGQPDSKAEGTTANVPTSTLLEGLELGDDDDAPAVSGEFRADFLDLSDTSPSLTENSPFVIEGERFYVDEEGDLHTQVDWWLDNNVKVQDGRIVIDDWGSNTPITETQREQLRRSNPALVEIYEREEARQNAEYIAKTVSDDEIQVTARAQADGTYKFRTNADQEFTLTPEEMRTKVAESEDREQAVAALVATKITGAGATRAPVEPSVHEGNSDGEGEAEASPPGAAAAGAAPPPPPDTATRVDELIGRDSALQTAIKAEASAEDTVAEKQAALDAETTAVGRSTKQRELDDAKEALKQAQEGVIAERERALATAKKGSKVTDDTDRTTKEGLNEKARAALIDAQVATTDARAAVNDRQKEVDALDRQQKAGKDRKVIGDDGVINDAGRTALDALQGKDLETLATSMGVDLKASEITTITDASDRDVAIRLAITERAGAIQAQKTAKEGELSTAKAALREKEIDEKLASERVALTAAASGSEFQAPVAAYIYSFITQTPRFPALTNAIFGSSDSFQEWKTDVDRFFANAYLGGYFEAKICEQFYDISPGEGAYVQTGPNSYQFVGSIQAERSKEKTELLLCDDETPCPKNFQCRNNLCYINQQATEPERGYRYKITWSVTAPKDVGFTLRNDEARDEVDFNLRVDSTWLFRNPTTGAANANTNHLGLGNSSRQTSLPPIIIETYPDLLNKACIIFGENKPRDWRNNPVDEICNPIVPTEVGELVQGVPASEASAGSEPTTVGQYCGLGGC